jgi:SAM-dependent methyltransferase
MESIAASDKETLVAKVREKYGQIASAGSSCCGPTATTCGTASASVMSQSLGYEAGALEAVPEGADLGLGCGAPIGHLDLRPGETVLDLGSGAGLDAFLAAQRVGGSGHVIGVDMTPEMLSRARDNARKIGVGNVEFREGRLEALPIDDASIDAVTSNCVINLVPDKAAVFREIARVLKSGGRLVVSDIILDGRLPEAIEQDLYAYVGCVSGALQRAEYFDLIEAAGLGSIELLKDIDYGVTVMDTAPAEAQRLFDKAEASREEVVGKVRSVTFRAVKPA